MHGRGLAMLTKQLDLTPDQVSQIQGIYADEGTQMKALHEDTSLAQADKRQKMFAIHKDSHEKFHGGIESRPEDEVRGVSGEDAGAPWRAWSR